MYPVRRVIELPVGMPVALLQRVPGAHAQLNRDHVGLPGGVWKVVRGSGKAHRIAVDSEDRAGADVMVVAHRLKGGRVGRRNHAEMRAATGERLRVGRRDAQSVDYPALGAAALVVEYDKAGADRKDVDATGNCP